MLKAVREIYPSANLCVIGNTITLCCILSAISDYDPSASFVNQLNRIKLLLGCAKDRTVSSLQPLCTSVDVEDMEQSCTQCPSTEKCTIVKTKV